MRVSLAIALVLLASPMAAAQTAHPTDVAIGYRYLQGEMTTRISTTPLSTDLPRGFEVTLTSRVAPVVSLVAQFGHSTSSPVTSTSFGSPANPNVHGTASATVSDLMGGIKIAKAGSSVFVQILGGVSMPDLVFDNVSSASQSIVSFDQGRKAGFALRPEVGLEFRSSSSGPGIRVQAGWDVILTSSSAASGSTTHFRIAAAAVIPIVR